MLKRFGTKYFSLLLILMSLLSCTPKKDKIQVFYCVINSNQDRIEFIFGNDSVYSFVLTQLKDDRIPSFIISTGTYTKKGREYNLKESLTGKKILLRMRKNIIVPESGRYKNLLFLNTDQIYIKDAEATLSENLLNEYKTSIKIKNFLNITSKNKLLLHSFPLNYSYCFGNGNVILNIKQNGYYELLFDDIIYSSGICSFTEGILRFTDHQSEVEYNSFLYKDSTIIMGSLPFSTEFCTLKLLSVGKHILMNPNSPQNNIADSIYNLYK